MRIGLLIDPIDPDLGYVENLKKASELGFRVVQLWYRDLRSHIEGKARDVLQLLGDLELELKSLAAYTDILDTKRGWSEVFDELKRAIDFAAEARIRWVVTESGGVPGKLNEWDSLIDRFSQLLNYAGSCGVMVLVENGPGVLVNDTKLMLRFIEELNSDWVGINFDPANLNLVPDDVLGAVETLGGYIRDTHAKDSILLTQGSGRVVADEHIFVVPEGEDFIHLTHGVVWALPPIGEGDVPFSDYINSLRKVHFSGDLIIEYQGGGDREKAIVRCKRYLEDILEENQRRQDR